MNDTRSDNEIIDAVLSGRVNDFESIVRRYERKVYSTALSVVRDRALAEDVSQEVFFKAYRALPTFRRESAFSTFLYRICYNTAVSFLRRQPPPDLALDRTDDDGDDYELPIADEGPLPVEHVEAEERREALWRAIHALSENYRQVIVLRELDGCSYQEIADTLGIPLGTVKVRILRARASLKALLLQDALFQQS